MLHINIDEQNAIAIFEPDEKLSESDFKSAVKIIDPYINTFGKLSGLIISTETFPGWESFAALISHLCFIKDHQKKISFIALVTDSKAVNLAEGISSHFIAATIKTFAYGELEAAKAWIIENSG